VFADVGEVEVGRQVENLELPTDEQRQEMARLNDAIAIAKQATVGDSPSEAAQQRLKELEGELGKLRATIRKTLVTQAVPRRTTRILPRGNWLDESGEVVDAAIPAVFQPVTGEQIECNSRLDFARWLVSDGNPLTPRVFVNHLWRVMFGTGLVTTAEDFGAQGSYPTHPMLLDWLAGEFRDSGWNVKHLLKLIAMSRVYQQSSDTDALSLQHDPFNRWLNRQHRYRLEAEFVRDNALAVSGLLKPEIGGASVKPYQPDGYWAQLNFPKRTYRADDGDRQYRRGLYTYWCRTFLHPSLVAFDAPSREECTARRTRSNTPLQALVLLNDPSYVEAARALTDLVLGDPPTQNGEDDHARIKWAFERVLFRAATPPELEVVQRVLNEQRARYRSSPGDARSLLRVGQQPDFKGDDLAAAEAAAWMSAMRVMLNLHETITRS
ncbi:MAG: DUF1553 domain-containing protein, partial [Planctomycetales bacterium]|nr:DUF1553 domain-containing protein [Planctomycetales bacterium]